MRLIKSLFVVMAMSALIAGATNAYFTDKEVISNTFASGKVDIDIRGPNKDGIVIPIDTTQTFQGGMAPGVSYGPYAMNIYNKGWGQSTLPVKYRWTEEKTGGSDAMYEKINVIARQGNCDWNPDAQPISYQGGLKDMEVVSTSPLDPNITRCTWFWFELDPTAGNQLQGEKVEFDLIIDATQTNNPGWDE